MRYFGAAFNATKSYFYNRHFNADVPFLKALTKFLRLAAHFCIRMFQSNRADSFFLFNRSLQFQFTPQRMVFKFSSNIKRPTDLSKDTNFLMKI